MRVKQVAAEFKAADDLGEGEFLVYPSTFTREPDSYGDVVAKDAFDVTLKQWADSGRSMPGLFGHRMDDPDFFVAHATSMGTDEHGWWVRGAFDLDNPKAAQVYRLVKAGQIAELSFAFDVLEEGRVELEDGTKANELREVKVYEFSFVPIGANSDTSIVAVKAADVEAGRALSASNDSVLREAADLIDAAADSIKNVLAQVGEADDGAKAADTGVANPEEPAGAKGEEPDGFSEAAALSLTVEIASRV